MSDVGKAEGFTVVREIAVGRGAVSGIAVSPDGSTLTVTHHGDDSVSLVTTAGRAPTLTVTDVNEPLAVATVGRRAYVSSVAAAYDEVLALDTDSEYIVASYPVGFSVTDLAVSPSGRYVYAARTGADVAVVDTSTGVQTSIAIPATTIGCVRVSPDGRRLYVAANGATTAGLVVVDTRRHRVVSTVDIGSPIRDIALSPDGGTAYVASCGPDFGTVLDVLDLSDTRSAAIDATYKIGDTARTLAQLIVSRNGERAYLVGDQHVTVLSTATQEVLGSITVGDQPSCVVESPNGARLYIADYAGTLTELEIASAAARTSASLDRELAAPGAWTYSDLLMLEPSLV